MMKTKLLMIGLICLSLVLATPARAQIGFEGELNQCIADCKKASTMCDGLNGLERSICNKKMADECAIQCTQGYCKIESIFDLQQFVADYADMASYASGVYLNTALLGEAADLLAVDIVKTEKGVVVNLVKRTVTVDPATGDYIVVEDAASFLISPDLAFLLWDGKADDVNFVNEYYKPAQMNLSAVIDMLEFIGFPKVILTPDGGIDFYATQKNAVMTLSDGEFLLLASRITQILSNAMTLAFTGYQNNVILELNSETGEIKPVDSYAMGAFITQHIVGLLLSPDPYEPPVLCKYQECFDPNGLCESKCEQCMDAGGTWDWRNFQCIPASVPCEYSVCFDRDKNQLPTCDDLNAYCEKFYPEGCDPNAKLEMSMAAVIILPVCPW